MKTRSPRNCPTHGRCSRLRTDRHVAPNRFLAPLTRPRARPRREAAFFSGPQTGGDRRGGIMATELRYPWQHGSDAGRKTGPSGLERRCKAIACMGRRPPRPLSTTCGAACDTGWPDDVPCEGKCRIDDRGADPAPPCAQHRRGGIFPHRGGVSQRRTEAVGPVAQSGRGQRRPPASAFHRARSAGDVLHPRRCREALPDAGAADRRGGPRDRVARIHARSPAPA